MSEVANIKQSDMCEISQKNELTEGYVREYICKLATKEEINFFITLCKHHKLNPFLKEAYLVKYKSSVPASTIISKDIFLRRASNHKDFDGYETSITQDGRESIANAKVYRKNLARPICVSVYMSEYNSNQSIWLKKPKTMLRKVALSQALREAFPEEFHGLYDESEISDMSAEKPAAKAQLKPARNIKTIKPDAVKNDDGVAECMGESAVFKMLEDMRGCKSVDELKAVFALIKQMYLQNVSEKHKAQLVKCKDDCKTGLEAVCFQREAICGSDENG